VPTRVSSSLVNSGVIKEATPFDDFGEVPSAEVEAAAAVVVDSAAVVD
jgi:hypothetical protein